MLVINLCLDKRRVSAACKHHGKLYSEAFYLYFAENRGETLAEALFEVESDRVRVIGYDCSDEDPFLFDGVLRAGLNYAGGQGIENGFIPESFRYNYRHLFERLNYPSGASFNIVNFFHKYKNCAKL